MPGEKISFREAILELCNHGEKVGISRVRSAKQLIGYAVGVLKNSGLPLEKVLEEIKTHWDHITTN